MYLIVKFYDNDFGRPMLAALERLWGWINTNNAHLAGHGDYLTIPQIYRRLLEQGALEQQLLRLFVLEDRCYDVEGRTRGLYNWDKWTNKEVGIDNPDDPGPPNTYLSVEVLLCDTLGAAWVWADAGDNGWANGECARLDLETGEATIF